jgi:hypothetical protein
VAFITVRHASAGQIAIRIVPGNNHLEWMHDVLLGSPSDNNLLAWDSATSMWTNQTAAQAGVATSASPTFTGTVTTPLTTAGYVKTTSGGVISSSAAVPQADVTNLVSDLAGKAPTSHTHTQSQVTNLTTDLAAKANLSGATFTGVVKGMIPEEIGNAVNLNTYVTTGIYHQQANVQAASGTNYPIGEAGMLTVTTGASSGFIYQTYQAFSGGNNRIYWRGRYEGTWSAWRQLRDITFSTGDPSGGVNGDVWLKYTP